MRQKGLSTEVSARTGKGVDFGLRFSLASYRANMLVRGALIIQMNHNEAPVKPCPRCSPSPISPTFT
jgi:hypothetical protein